MGFRVWFLINALLYNTVVLAMEQSGEQQLSQALILKLGGEYEIEYDGENVIFIGPTCLHLVKQGYTLVFTDRDMPPFKFVAKQEHYQALGLLACAAYKLALKKGDLVPTRPLLRAENQ